MVFPAAASASGLFGRIEPRIDCHAPPRPMLSPAVMRAARVGSAPNASAPFCRSRSISAADQPSPGWKAATHTAPSVAATSMLDT